MRLVSDKKLFKTLGLLNIAVKFANSHLYKKGVFVMLLRSCHCSLLSPVLIEKFTLKDAPRCVILAFCYLLGEESWAVWGISSLFRGCGDDETNFGTGDWEKCVVPNCCVLPLMILPPHSDRRCTPLYQLRWKFVMEEWMAVSSMRLTKGSISFGLFEADSRMKICWLFILWQHNIKILSSERS